MLKLCSKEQKRRSAKFKTEVVLSLLCGESAEELSRKHGVTMADIAQWRDEFIAYGTQGFKKNPEDSKPPGLFAVRKGLEPSTSGVTGRHSNQLNYRTGCSAFSRNADANIE